MSGIFDQEPIYAYTRAQAIEDGTLTDVAALFEDEPDFGKAAGWAVPVALSVGVADIVLPSDAEAHEGQSAKGRLWDVLMMARTYGIAQKAGGTWIYPCLFAFHRPDRRNGRRHREEFQLKAVVGPGEDGEPVLTICLPEED